MFNTMTKLSIPAENFPFCTIDPNNARVTVPDARFDWLVSGGGRPKRGEREELWQEEEGLQHWATAAATGAGWLGEEKELVQLCWAGAANGRLLRACTKPGT